MTHTSRPTKPKNNPLSRSKQLARKRGFKVEQLGAEYLQQHNLFLVQSNYFCRTGELDLIFLEQSTLVFVEVKYRKKGLEQALESITPKKQQRIIKASSHFLLSHPQYQGHNCRFDVLAAWQEAANSSYDENKSIIFAGKKLCFHWLKNAFTL